MAALEQSAVTVNGYWYEGVYNDSKRKVVDATLVLTGQGGLTNNIPASLFGLRNIKGVRSARNDSSVLILAAPSYDEAYVVLGSTNGAGTPTDTTATVRLEVVGEEDL